MSADRDLIRARFSGSLGAFWLDVEFEAPTRGITALYGPSGCGKTTVLRCVAGLSRMAGSLTVGREVWQNDDAGLFRKPHRRAVGYVFQEASLFPHLSVHRNLQYGARRAAETGSDDLLPFDDVVDLLGIGSLVNRSPSALSGGERQRVAIGRALLSRPRLLLMDEPLSGLDQVAKEGILPYLEALHERLSIPIIYVSHDIREVARLADKIVVLSNGRPVAAGPVDRVLERLDLELSAGPFEAGVVLRARVAGHDPRFRMTRLVLNGQEIVIPGADLRVGDEVRLRIRARDVVLAKSRPAAISVRNILEGTIVEIAEDAETAFAEVLVDVGGGRLRARITRDASADLELTAGMGVYALVKSISFDRPAIGPSRSEAVAG